MRLIQQFTSLRAIPIILASLVGLMGGQSHAQNASPRQETRHRNFRIPFRLNADEVRRSGAVSAVLFVKAAGEQNWTQAANAKLTDSHFEYRVRGDGQYDFAVRTADAFGAIYPPSALVPELAVSVDSTPPSLQLQAQPTNDGRIELTWSADDPGLQASSLTLQPAMNGRPSGQPINAGGRPAGTLVIPAPRVSGVSVIAAVQDRAGNQMTAEVQLPVSSQMREAELAALPAEFPRDPEGASANLPTQEFSPSSLPSRTANFSTQQPFIPPQDNDWPTTSALAPNRTPVSPVNYRGSDERSLLSPPAHTGAVSHQYTPTPASRGPVSQIVAERSFDIEYQVDVVGSSGISQVNLYVTQDGGARWWMCGNDADKQSPASITVPADGSYGLAIRITNGAGLAPAPPKPGEKPEMIVIVDTEAPNARLLPIDSAHRANPGVVPIRWETQEANPAAKAVRLEYAPDAAGPWNLITDWVSDAGRFDWRIPNSAPGQVLIRMSVRDAAGNLTHTQLPQPVILDLTKPAARLTGVRASSGF